MKNKSDQDEIHDDQKNKPDEGFKVIETGDGSYARLCG